MLSAEMRKKGFEVRAILDSVVDGFGAADEAGFNAAAAKINEKAAAIRVYNPDKDYKRGEMAVDPSDGIPYWAMHDHGPATGQVHRPHETPTIWTHCHGTTPETARPFMAEGHNPYMAGHYCTENGHVKRCTQNNTVHAPSVLPGAWEDA